MPDIVVGIDLGGTYVRAGTLDTQGNLISFAEAPIEASRGPREGVQRIQNLIEMVLRQVGLFDLKGIGVGSTGPVDRERGAIQNPYTLPTWEDVDILTPLKEHFGVPAALENDADAAALGEYWSGAGQGIERLAVVTIGTGIGTAFVYRGELYRGMAGVHPEIGHQVLDPSGPLCYCGARGCWESLASGTAIGQMGRMAAARIRLSSVEAFPGGLLELCGGDLERIEGRQVAQAAEAGDPAAIEVIQKAAYYLALGLVNLVIFLVPDLVLLGGGVMKSYDQFQAVIRDTMVQHSLMVPASSVAVRKVALGHQAGVIGAGFAILKQLE